MGFFYSFLTILEAGKSKIKAPMDSTSDKDLLCGDAFLLSPYTAGSGKAVVQGLFCVGTCPIHEDFASPTPRPYHLPKNPAF